MASWFQLLLMVCVGVTHSEILDHRFFLLQIIEKYGHDGNITLEGFERLYENLGLGKTSLQNYANSLTATHTLPEQPPSVTTRLSSQDLPLSRSSRSSSSECNSEEELAKIVVQHDEVPQQSLPLSAQQCLSPRKLLAVYGLPSAVAVLSPVSFLHLCPAIIYHLDQRTCVWGEDGHQHIISESITHMNWLFAGLSVLVISVSGLLCVAVVPLLHKNFVSQLINFLVALAVGTLLGDAFLHLIPHALEAHGAQGGHTDSVMKTGLMFLTVVFFFTFEATLNAIRAKKGKNNVQENVDYVSVRVTQNEKETIEMSEGHTHSHSPQNNTALMVIMGDGLHNLTDGLAIGAAFSGGLAPGFATAVAVFTHELPHELGDFAVLLKSGMTVQKAMLYNLLSSVLSILGTIVGLIIGNFGDATRWIYAVTAGSFIYIALSNLVPEINQQKTGGRTIVLRLFGVLSGAALMGCIALFEHDIQHLFS